MFWPIEIPTHFSAPKLLLHLHIAPLFDPPVSYFRCNHMLAEEKRNNNKPLMFGIYEIGSVTAGVWNKRAIRKEGQGRLHGRQGHKHL